MNIINYTIIIPSKNRVHLLARCLASIPERNDLQVIIVDDNSDPINTNFSDYPGLNRGDTEVIFTTVNKGAGYARNIGLSKAKGKWILFADSDDFFENNFLNLLDSQKNFDADIVYFNINSKYSDDLTDASRHQTVDFLIKSASNSNDHIKKLKFSFLEPFAKCYRHEFIIKNKISFDEVRFSNDTLFALKAAVNANKIIVINSILYCVTVSKGSLTNVISRESVNTRIDVLIRANQLLIISNERKYLLSLVPQIIAASKISILFMFEVIVYLLWKRQNLLIGSAYIFRVIKNKFSSEYRHHSNRSKISKVNHED